LIHSGDKHLFIGVYIDSKYRAFQIHLNVVENVKCIF